LRRGAGRMLRLLGSSIQQKIGCGPKK
jgi:hypothetical protein